MSVIVVFAERGGTEALVRGDNDWRVKHEQPVFRAALSTVCGAPLLRPRERGLEARPRLLGLRWGTLSTGCCYAAPMGPSSWGVAPCPNIRLEDARLGVCSSLRANAEVRVPTPGGLGDPTPCLQARR